MRSHARPSTSTACVARAVRMAVDHSRDAEVPEGGVHGAVVDVHDRLGLERRRIAALATQPQCDQRGARTAAGASRRRWRRRIANARAVLLIRDVAGAQLVAMQHQRRRAADVDELRDRAAATRRSSRRSARRAGSRGCRAPRRPARRTAARPRIAAATLGANGSRELVVADPRVEQVAEDVDLGGAARRPVAERSERRHRGAALGRKCRSDRNSRGFIAAHFDRQRDRLGLADHDVVDGHVLVPAAAAGRDALDLVDDVRAFDDLAEHAVTPALRARALVVEEVVVGDVDEELRASPNAARPCAPSRPCTCGS